jgi:hypothetical protein
MLLHNHIYEQLRHERQRDLLREGEARRARAAAVAPQPQAEEPAVALTSPEKWCARPRAAADRG